MCGGCCYNSHLSPRGLVPAFTLKHTSPSLWLLLSLQDACYTENLILYYWQMTKNVIEIEQETQCIEDAVGYRWGQNCQPTFFTLCYSAYTKCFFLNCQGSKLLSPLMLTVNCVSFLLDNRLKSFATHVSLAIPVSSSSRVDGHLVWTLIFSSCPFNGIQMRAWITPSLTSTLVFWTKSNICFGALSCWETKRLIYVFFQNPSFLEITSTLMRICMLDTLKHSHSIIHPPPCFTVGSVFFWPLPSFSKHKQCICDQRALASFHMIKGCVSSVHNLSPGCYRHTSVRLQSSEDFLGLVVHSCARL